MQVDYDALKFWWGVALTLGNIGLFIFTWISSKDKGNESRIGALEKQENDRHAEIDSRLIKVETEIEHMPTASDMASLRVNVQGLQTSVQAMTNSLTAMSLQIELINQHLLNNA